MNMNRRNVLFGLGAIVAGGGAALGTGAFSSVEAQRSASISTAGDASAFLGLEAHPDRSADGTPNNPDNSTEGTPYLTLIDNNNTLEFNFDGSGEGPTITGSGLNQQATTEFDDLIVISNQGQDSVTLNVSLIESDETIAPENSVFEAYASSDSTGSSISSGDVLDGSASLNSGESVDVGFRIDLTDSGNITDSDYTDSNPQQNYGENVDSIQIIATA